MKLEKYRPSMTNGVLHSWAVDAEAAIERLRAALAVSESATAAAVKTAQWQASTNKELNDLQDKVRRLQADTCRRLNDEFGA